MRQHRRAIGARAIDGIDDELAGYKFSTRLYTSRDPTRLANRQHIVAGARRCANFNEVRAWLRNLRNFSGCVARRPRDQSMARRVVVDVEIQVAGACIANAQLHSFIAGQRDHVEIVYITAT